MRVLVESDDHSYYETTVRRMKVVYNQFTGTYSGYFGDDYLEDGDEVVERDVVN